MIKTDPKKVPFSRSSRHNDQTFYEHKKNPSQTLSDIFTYTDAFVVFIEDWGHDWSLNEDDLPGSNVPRGHHVTANLAVTFGNKRNKWKEFFSSKSSLKRHFLFLKFLIKQRICRFCFSFPIHIARLYCYFNSTFGKDSLIPFVYFILKIAHIRKIGKNM